MNAIKFYFFDCSAIVKLLLPEKGSKKVKDLLDASSSISTSWVLLSETLNVLKRKWLKKELDENEYAAKVYYLFSLIEERRIYPVDVDSTDGRARLGTYKLDLVSMRKKHPSLDAADALQLLAIQQSFLKYLAGESAPQLVTADAGLRDAAQSEGLQVVFISQDE